MDLFEYQAKELFAKHNVPTTPGRVTDTAEGAKEIATEIGAPVMVKAQVKVGGRGKAGGVKYAATPEDAYEHAKNILGLDIKGHVVKKLLVAEASDIAEEYYISFLLDRANRTYLAMCSVEGGVEIEEVAATKPDRLAKVPVNAVKGVDLAYVRPGSSLAGYTQVILDPVSVSFHKDWDPKKPGSPFNISAADRERIAAGVARIVQDQFTKALTAKGGYPIVAAPGPGVLRVKADIINLYVTAPDVKAAGRTRTYTRSAGQMTLVAQLVDSESGEVIARLIDRREATNGGVMTRSSSVSNANEAQIIATRWARTLRSALDSAEAPGAQ